MDDELANEVRSECGTIAFGFSVHPIKQMRILGIKYDFCVPKSVGDCFWFFDCTNVPSKLPDYLRVMKNPIDEFIGHGLDEIEIARLKARENVE
jgi:hypothetical protein